MKKHTRSESSSNWGGTGVSGELQHGTLSVRTGRDDEHFGGVFDSDDGTGSQQKLLPGPTQVDDMDTIRTTFINVLFHLEIDIGRTKVRASGQHLGNIVLFEAKYL